MPVGMSRPGARSPRPVEQVRGGEPALVVGGAGQRREADHVAHGVDVRHGGLEVLVDLDLPAAVGL